MNICKTYHLKTLYRLRFSTFSRHALGHKMVLNGSEFKFVQYVSKRWSLKGSVISHTLGIDHLRDPTLNKGLAFTIEERQALGIHGLIPARIKTQREQVELCLSSVLNFNQRLNQYIYLSQLLSRNQKLFFRLLSENIEKLVPIVYTPTVGLACQKFGLLYNIPRGLFLTINDKGHCYEVLQNWPENYVRIIVVTDGERVLGLGDLGASGMLIPVGKSTLYTVFAGIKPELCLPIMLDVGTNNDELLEDPLYLGLRQRRVTGHVYDEFLDEFMEAIVRRYGQNTLVHFEDFAGHNAFRLLKKYQRRYCMFNDDIQGTGSVALAGLLVSERITGMKLTDHRILCFGAGQAARGIADLCVTAMKIEGLSTKDATNKIWMVDVEGLVEDSRTDLDEHMSIYAKNHPPESDLLKLVREIKPSVLIGASGIGSSFKPDILQTMASLNDRPIIFALSNPTDKAECTAEEAYTHTDGRVIFASGSPFDPVSYKGETYRIGQGNTAWVYPAIGLSAIFFEMHHVPEEVLLVAAHTLAENVTDEDLSKGSIYPALTSSKEIAIKIATAICQYAYEKGLASVYPEPKDKMSYIKSNLYDYNYRDSLVTKWSWPVEKRIRSRA